jgi:hypothetical protein
MIKYAKLDFGLVEAVFDKLGGIEGAESFVRGESLVKTSERAMEVWKTIRLGTFKNADEARRALKSAGCSVSTWATNILGRPDFTLSETLQEVDLVNVSVEDLGFKNSASHADICKRALELGLKLCSPEVGVQLRLQWSDQPKGTFVVIGMEAIADPEGSLDVFSVRCLQDGEKTLFAKDENVWNACNRIVLVSPRSV